MLHIETEERKPLCGEKLNAWDAYYCMVKEGEHGRFNRICDGMRVNQRHICNECLKLHTKEGKQ